METCAGCSLGMHPQVAPVGPEDSPVVLVGECPGKTEIKRGVPFVGSAGQLLKDVLRQAGISYSKCRVQNSFMCIKPSTVKDVAQLLEFALPCRERLREDIERFPRRLIIAFGKCACSVVGQHDIRDPITDYHGNIEDSRFSSPDGTPIPVLYAVHPAAALRSGGTDSPMRQMLVEDIGKAVRFLKRIVNQSGDSPYIEGYFELMPDIPISVDRVITDAIGSGSLALDIETTCLSPFDPDAKILGISLCGSRNRSLFTTNASSAMKKVLKVCREYPQLDVIGHNCKFDAQWLGKVLSIDPSMIFTYDTMLAGHLIANTKVSWSKGIHEYAKVGLKSMTETVLGIDDLWDDEALVARQEGSLATLDQLKLARYAAADAWATRELYAAQKDPLAGEGLEKTLREVVMVHSNLFADVEIRPVYIDTPLVQHLGMGIDEELAEIASRLETATGVVGFNPNSSKQVTKFLFEDLGLKSTVKTDTGAPSANNEVLESLAHFHEGIGLIIRYRSLRKMKGAYVENLLENSRQDESGSWYVTPSYNLASTITGRTSCRDPNIQQMPKAIRGIFIPPPGYVFLCADMRQAEARVMAMYCKDPALIDVFSTRECPACGKTYHCSHTLCPECLVVLNPTDPYRTMAQRMYGHEDISKAERNSAKVAYLAGIYQESAAALAAREGVSKAVAESWLNSLASAYPLQQRWISSTKTEVRSAPFEVVSLYGRRRRLKEFFSYRGDDPKEAEKMRAQGYRQAVNSPVQSASSDMCLLAMARAHRRLIDEGIGWTQMFIHDEIDAVIENNPRSIKRAKTILREEMRKSPVPEVNLEVEMEVRSRWEDPELIDLWLAGKVNQRGEPIE